MPYPVAAVRQKNERIEQYYERLLSLFGADIVAYWPLWELSGIVAADIKNGLNGSYTGVVLGQPGIGDGQRCPSFDGSGDFVDIYSAGLNTAFSGVSGSMLIQFAIADATILTDGLFHVIAEIRVDVNNRLEIYIQNTTLYMDYVAGGTAEQITGIISAANINFKSLVVNWSDAADAVSLWVGGTQVGATATGIGTWVGNLAATRCRIGAEVASLSWKGRLAHALILDRPMTPAEIVKTANP